LTGVILKVAVLVTVATGLVVVSLLSAVKVATFSVVVPSRVVPRGKRALTRIVPVVPAARGD